MATTPDSAATALDASDESSTALLYRSAIGTQGLDFYLKVFTRFDALDRAGLSWNTAASLCTINWMILHRMWAAAVVYAGSLIGLALLIFGIGQLVFQFSETTTWIMVAVFASLFIALPGLFGNAVFHTHCRKRMESALAASATVEDACKLLERKAGSKRRVIILALVNLLWVLATAMAYWLFPQRGAVGAELKKAAEGGHVASGRATESNAVAASAPATPASSAATDSAATAAVAQAQAPAPPASSEPPHATIGRPAVAASALKATASTAPTVARRSATADLRVAAIATTPQSAAQVSPPTTKNAAAKARAVALDPASFYINVGLFGKADNARNAYARVRDAGISAFTQELKGKNGKLTRVRAGPFLSQADADAAAEKIHSLGLDAEVFKP
jgi:cell division septation protein DedD